MVLRKPIIDPSLSSEEKIKKLSIVVERLGRRAVKQTSAILTPIPISSCIKGDVSGEVLKYMFCGSGILNKGGIYLNKKPSEGAIITLIIDNDLGGSSRSYVITRNNLLFEPKIEISIWDRLTISLTINNPEKDIISEIWIALMWTPSVKESTIKNYLIDNLDSNLDIPEE